MRLETALWHALKARRLERGGPAELLLAKLGKAALAERNGKGDTMLHWAAGKGCKEEVAWLALAGADLLATNARGKVSSLGGRLASVRGRRLCLWPAVPLTLQLLHFSRFLRVSRVQQRA